ncbi:FadR/GntR family transcriptional regulator [Thalassospira marina]|uniref:GntR family transcriptional regulator n=1 Tax=Thalassospira marina TaxID=2048283 RepID=A0ABM6QD87_9PROT|nr:FadR/GntR family transcriptional regulator [Thalassospira marina]AUG54563.1 GntR family transcriptional regulator [Thalassospira marina]
MQKTDPNHYEKIIRPRRLPDEIAANLTGQISNGILRPGDKLPTEQELASNYGVARTVVREAVSQLKSDGMIQSKQGVGAFVSEPGSRNVFRISPDCFAKRKELVQILQLRTSNEAGAAALAADARSEEDLVRIHDELQSMQGATGQSSFEMAEHRYDAERRFYRAIARASGNGYFYDFLTMLDGRIDANLRNVAIKNVMTAEWGEAVFAEHKMVYEAIRTQNRTAAEMAVRQHFENAAGRLMERADIADIAEI